MKTKLGNKFWFALTLFSFIGQVAWIVENMYFNVFIYKMFNASVSDISLMVSASAVAATLTTIFIGTLSDKIGKRKLFMCLGYILWGISIISFVFVRKDIISSIFGATVNSAAVGVSIVIILDCVMTFFGSSANDAAFNAWLTDSTDSTNRGSAEGVNSMMPLVAILAVFGGFMALDLEKSESWSYIFLIIGAIVLIVGVIGFFIIEDKYQKVSDDGYFKSILYGFNPSTIASNKTFYLTLLCFTVFNISIQVFMPYLILYYEESLGMADYVLIMAPAIILASAFTFVWGRIYDKKGFYFSVAVSCILLFAGYVLLYLFKQTALVFAGSLFMMCGYLSGAGVFGAKVRDLTPRNKAGMLQGVRIVSQVLIPGIIGPFISKCVLSGAELVYNNDGTTSFIPNSNIFIAALGVALICVLIICAIKKKETK